MWINFVKGYVLQAQILLGCVVELLDLLNQILLGCGILGCGRWDVLPKSSTHSETRKAQGPRDNIRCYAMDLPVTPDYFPSPVKLPPHLSQGFSSAWRDSTEVKGNQSTSSHQCLVNVEHNAKHILSVFIYYIIAQNSS